MQKQLEEIIQKFKDSKTTQDGYLIISEFVELVFQNDTFVKYTSTEGNRIKNKLMELNADKGDLLNCPASAKFPLGNIKKDALRDTWQRDKTQFFKTLPVKKTACKNCDVRQYCGSGCRIIAWQLHADYLAKDENSCPLYYFFRDRIRPIFQEFGIEEVSLPQNKDLFRFSKSDIQRFIGE